MSDHETTLRTLADCTWLLPTSRAACLAGADALRRGTCGTCKWLRHVGAREDDTEPACGHESEAHPLHWCLPVGNPETFGCTFHEPMEPTR